MQALILFALLSVLGALCVCLRRLALLQRQQNRESAKLFLSEAVFTAQITKYVDHDQLTALFADLDLVDELAIKYAHMLRADLLPLSISRRQLERLCHCRPDGVAVCEAGQLRHTLPQRTLPN